MEGHKYSPRSVTPGIPSATEARLAKRRSSAANTANVEERNGTESRRQSGVNRSTISSLSKRRDSNHNLDAKSGKTVLVKGPKRPDSVSLSKRRGSQQSFSDLRGTPSPHLRQESPSFGNHGNFRGSPTQQQNGSYYNEDEEDQNVSTHRGTNGSDSLSVSRSDRRGSHPGFDSQTPDSYPGSSRRGNYHLEAHTPDGRGRGGQHQEAHTPDGRIGRAGSFNNADTNHRGSQNLDVRTPDGRVGRAGSFNTFDSTRRGSLTPSDSSIGRKGSFNSDRNGPLYTHSSHGKNSEHEGGTDIRKMNKKRRHPSGEKMVSGHGNSVNSLRNMFSRRSSVLELDTVISNYRVPFEQVSEELDLETVARVSISSLFLC